MVQQWASPLSDRPTITTPFQRHANFSSSTRRLGEPDDPPKRHVSEQPGGPPEYHLQPYIPVQKVVGYQQNGMPITDPGHRLQRPETEVETQENTDTTTPDIQKKYSLPYFASCFVSVFLSGCLFPGPTAVVICLILLSRVCLTEKQRDGSRQEARLGTNPAWWQGQAAAPSSSNQTKESDRHPRYYPRRPSQGHFGFGDAVTGPSSMPTDKGQTETSKSSRRCIRCILYRAALVCTEPALLYGFLAHGNFNSRVEEGSRGEAAGKRQRRRGRAEYFVRS